MLVAEVRPPRQSSEQLLSSDTVRNETGMWKRTVGRTVDGLLGGSSGVNGGHETLDDPELYPE